MQVWGVVPGQKVLKALEDVVEAEPAQRELVKDAHIVMIIVSSKGGEKKRVHHGPIFFASKWNMYLSYMHK